MPSYPSSQPRSSNKQPTQQQQHHALTPLVKNWHWWLLYTSIPSLFVLVHFVWLSGEEEVAVNNESALQPLLTKSIASSTAAAAASSSDPPLRSFIDPVWAEWGSENSQYETLVPPSEVDYRIKSRLPWEQKAHSSQKEKKAAAGKCEDVMLFMPAVFARNGHGSQLNNYLLAAMLATYMGKAMVLLEAPEKYSKYPSGSQFGCPPEAFASAEEFLNSEGNNRAKLEMRRDFPKGLKRLVIHPSWISRDCPVPVCNAFDYNSWDAIRKAQRDYYSSGKLPKEIKCDEEEGQVMVTVVGGEEVRQYFERQFKKKMLDRSSRGARERAYNWAVRLGATDYQARVFSKTTEEVEIWDFVSALLARSGLVTLQPWIARDVREFIQSSKLPLDQPHDSIHVRRGDKLATEAREEVVNYWHSQGFERQEDFPLNYIPFTHYLRLWETDCQSVWSGEAKGKRRVRTIYVATDDPDNVKEEIKKLPRGQGGTVIVGGCERVKFVFSPEAHHGSFHISDGGVKADCVERYKRNIHSIADLMILTKSNTFVGEFNSNWGRIVRVFRTQLNDMYVMPDDSFSWKGLLGMGTKEGELPELSDEPRVLVHDIRVAFAEDKPVPPPGW
jgi:hypothetical protein